MTRTHKTRNQRQRRRAGQVRRLEVVLSAESERDHSISEFLDALPSGTASEFIRQAIHAAIERDTAPPQPEAASAEFNAILAELAEIREAVQHGQPVPVAVPIGEGGPGTVQSSGLDMSRPRKKAKGPSSASPPPTLPEVLSDQEQIDLARTMAASIRNAQPGRSQ